MQHDSSGIRVMLPDKISRKFFWILWVKAIMYEFTVQIFGKAAMARITCWKSSIPRKLILNFPFLYPQLSS